MQLSELSRNDRDQSSRSESNRRPAIYKKAALTTELREGLVPHRMSSFILVMIFTLSRRAAAHLSIKVLSTFRQSLGLLGSFLNTTDVEERRFGQVVPLAVAQFLEADDRLFARRDLALLPGERFRDEERL